MTLLRRPGAALATLLFLLMGAAFLTQVVPYGQIVDANRQVQSARAQLADLEEENASLQADVAALETPAEIEKLAREKLGYVRPGETAYVVLDPPGTPEESDTAPAQPVEEKTWVDEVWEFLSGADLDS
ncbi:MAG TPA: septum formation initiator family protein [Acidimicrobiia bacterium]